MTISKEKKTLLLSIIVVGIAATMLGAGTLAYFSSTVEIENNLFTAGTIELNVDRSLLNNTVNFSGNLSDLKPCMKGWGNVTLKNNGTNPMDVWLNITDVSTDGGLETAPELAEEASLNADQKHNIDTVIRYDLYIDGAVEIDDAMNFTISDGAHHLATITNGVKDQYIYLGDLDPLEEMEVQQSFEMDCNTTNWAQGDEMSFTVVFYAQQSEGNPPSPTPELTGHGK